MPTNAAGGYNPSLTTPSLGDLVSTATGSPHSSTQEYTVALGWLAVLQRAAAHMTATPRLRKDGVLLAKAIAAATGTISASTAGAMVTIPATVMARLVRSSAKHLGAKSRLLADTEVKEVDRPLRLLTDSVVSDPKTLSLTAKAGIADIIDLPLSADSLVSGEENAKLLTGAVVLAVDSYADVAVDSAVLFAGVSEPVDADAAVKAEQFLSMGADAAAQYADQDESLDADSAVQEETALSLSSKAAVQVGGVSLGLGVGSAIKATMAAPVTANAAVARTYRREMSTSAFVVFRFSSNLELSADSIIQFLAGLDLSADCSVIDPDYFPDQFASYVEASTYVILRGQLDADTYVVPLPKATWVYSQTAVLVTDTAQEIGADTFVIT